MCVCACVCICVFVCKEQQKIRYNSNLRLETLTHEVCFYLNSKSILKTL